jgi:hypothetical protein
VKSANPNLRATDKASSGEDVYLAAKAEVDASSSAAFAAVDAAKKAKEQVAVELYSC